MAAPVPPASAADAHLGDIVRRDALVRIIESAEMVALRAEFPGHKIWTETIMNRSRYVACSQAAGARPHTVITRDFDELRLALEAGRPRP